MLVSALAGFDELKNADRAVLAPGHPLTQARQARHWARRLRDDAIALREEATALLGATGPASRA
jgi:hypothetical protein